MFFFPSEDSWFLGSANLLEDVFLLEFLIKTRGSFMHPLNLAFSQSYFRGSGNCKKSDVTMRNNLKSF